MLDRRVKSNRAQADYFELLVCQYICHLYNITFSYSKDLVDLPDKIRSLPGGTERLKLQKDNFIKIQPKIKEVLEYEIGQKGRIVDVIWMGRNLLIKTTSDVDAEHVSEQKTRFSIKSIANTGTGTLKNLGARQLKKFLSIDFSIEYNQMWENLRNFLDDFSSSQDKIKKRVQKDQGLLNWATDNGRKYQIILNALCFNAFNSLSLDKKIDFLNFITDCNDDDLYVIIINSSNEVIYKPVEKNLKFIKNIEARKDKRTDVGYTLFVDSKATYRVQTNNTNGIGISAFCQRIFWAEVPR